MFPELDSHGRRNGVVAVRVEPEQDPIIPETLRSADARVAEKGPNYDRRHAGNQVSHGRRRSAVGPRRPEAFRRPHFRR